MNNVFKVAVKKCKLVSLVRSNFLLNRSEIMPETSTVLLRKNQTKHIVIDKNTVRERVELQPRLTHDVIYFFQNPQARKGRVFLSVLILYVLKFHITIRFCDTCY
jgi:hypothetical protein